MKKWQITRFVQLNIMAKSPKLVWFKVRSGILKSNKISPDPNENIWPCSAEQTCLNASESWTILCRELLCVKIKISAESDINCSAWHVSTEKVSTISAESDVNYSKQNCQCWTCHLTLQSQTISDTNFFIRGYSP